MTAPAGLPDLEVLAPFVDWVLDRGEVMVVLHYGLVLVPDTVLLEGLANGHETPRTPTIVRPSDGRTVAVFTMPDKLKRGADASGT